MVLSVFCAVYVRYAFSLRVSVQSLLCLKAALPGASSVWALGTRWIRFLGHHDASPCSLTLFRLRQAFSTRQKHGLELLSFMALSSKSPEQPGSEVLSVLSLKTQRGDPGPAWVKCPHLDRGRGPSSTVAGLPGEEQLGAGQAIPLTSLTASRPGLQLGLQRWAGSFSSAHITYSRGRERSRQRDQQGRGISGHRGNRGGSLHPRGWEAECYRCKEWEKSNTWVSGALAGRKGGSCRWDRGPQGT